MPEVSLTAEPRQISGSRASNRLRREGLIPGVVYGRGLQATAVTVVHRDLRSALTGEAGFNALITLQVAGEEQLAIVKELQRDPVRHEVTHVDFILVSLDEEVTVEVPIHLEGEAHEVLVQGGTVDQAMYTLTVSAKPGQIPNQLTVDVSAMVIGDAIRVGDLQLPEGSSTEVDPEEPVVIAQVSQAAVEAEALDELAAAEAAAEEVAEGEAASEEGGGDAGASEESEG